MISRRSAGQSELGTDRRKSAPSGRAMLQAIPPINLKNAPLEREPAGTGICPLRSSNSNRESVMGLAEYMIVAQGDEWGVLHDGNVSNRYATKESAFEAAV